MTTVTNNGSNAGFTYSSRNNPCPVCNRTKDSDCRWKPNKELILCYTSAKQITPIDAPSGYVIDKPTKDNRCMQYVLKKDSTKLYTKTKAEDRKKVSETEYYYPDITIRKPGATITPTALPNDVYTPSVKVQRIDYIKDDSKKDKDFCQYNWDGIEWVKGCPKEIRHKIHLYQIAHPINVHAKIFCSPLLIVEGEKIVELLLKMGIAATTSIGGSGQWRGYGYCNYKEDIGNAQVVLCPDRDTKGLEYCEEIAKDFPDAKWLYAYPDSPIWENVPEAKGLDIADYIAECKLTKEDILASIEDRRSNITSTQGIFPIPNKIESSDNKKVTLSKQYQEVKELLGDRVRYNSLKKLVELDNTPIALEMSRLILAKDFNLQVNIGDAINIFTDIAEQNTYSPVVEYLDLVHTKYGNSTVPLLSDLSSRYFDTDKPIYNIYLRNTLIAAVARAYEPGCKAEDVLILQGKQGIGKSTFFRDLASRDWFDDSLGQVSDKDERLKLHNTWFIEWAELETVFKRKDYAGIKAFLSCTTDNLRPPYGRSVQEYKRPSIIVGSTNLDEFLSDPTGNRRFWVIPVQQTIDTAQLRSERDRIWAAAVSLYKSGVNWWLSEQDRQVSESYTNEHQISDVWQEDIAKYIVNLPTVTTVDILDNCIQIEKGNRNRGHDMRVANVLKQLGWTNKRIRHDGIPKRVWYPPENKM